MLTSSQEERQETPSQVVWPRTPTSPSSSSKPVQSQSLARTPLQNTFTDIPVRSNPLKEDKISIPALAFQLVESKYDWQYPATLYENEKYGKRFEAKNTRGKVLGGSSCLNYYTFIRGSRGTYDEWQEYGGSTWSWDNCFEYFQKASHVAPLQTLRADKNRSAQPFMTTTRF